MEAFAPELCGIPDGPLRNGTIGYRLEWMAAGAVLGRCVFCGGPAEDAGSLLCGSPACELLWPSVPRDWRSVLGEKMKGAMAAGVRRS